jgi:hypothetical protein
MDGLQIYYSAETSVEQALAVIERGVTFLRAAKVWWSETSGLWQPEDSVLEYTTVGATLDALITPIW